ncbi:hypothetical protein HN807_13165 [Candidatus Bathyarchaeota archaeon]|jgi:hypothetical protein|nr:hypothetical protein [Candidatus Bathyarchaeota archaeon]MBT4425172.1 hypothetical protein [Candidatus Bathyarchaeota archaeon]MBT7188163.1 hypothetical protein [Candidatus Bathyarchaeota archaeon]MBT7348023.1 hypothetical protein [Candidatus Bathyarchaeota archaeon]MBT7912480.1 hypothetical protein [Candidatus Bathyarchaeota archaeon]
MNILGTELSSRDIILGAGVVVLVLFSLWLHSQAIGMGFSLSSIPCSFCH